MREQTAEDVLECGECRGACTPVERDAPTRATTCECGLPMRLATEIGPLWKFILAHPKLMFSSPAFALAEMGK